MAARQEHPHPRAYGAFPHILRKYVREEKKLTLEDAIRKFSALPAQRMRLADRGVLKAGMWADIVVFDPETVRDVATFENPNQLSEGMRFVLVNGVPVIEEGKMTNALPGQGADAPLTAVPLHPLPRRRRASIARLRLEVNGTNLHRVPLHPLLHRRRAPVARLRLEVGGRTWPGLPQPTHRVSRFTLRRRRAPVACPRLAVGRPHLARPAEADLHRVSRFTRLHTADVRPSPAARLEVGGPRQVRPG